jgi:murein DD-endopeptidase MepM/ murein hydrolase activator NlpD
MAWGCRGPIARNLAAASLIAALAACSQGGGGATGGAAAIPNAAPDSRGIITYATYQVAVAQNGDTMQTIASRVGTSADELASKNALPLDYRLRAGEVLLLPDSVPRPTGTDLGTGDVTTRPLDWSPETASAAIDGSSGNPPAGNPFQNGQADPLIDPVRHRVEPGETAYSIARLYGVSVTALASWNGLGPDLTVRTNQELLIPIVSDANRISGAADTEPGQGTPVTPPPSAAAALPENITAAVEPTSPDLGQFRTPPGGRLAAPVSGTVNRPYNASNPNGIGYAVAPGTPVKAAAAGEVALISEELGGQGTIVLIRHNDDLMTTYSTLSDVTVKKGETVSAGEVIGKVAPRDKPELQFDVFRGTTSVDPTTYVGG